MRHIKHSVKLISICLLLNGFSGAYAKTAGELFDEGAKYHRAGDVGSNFSRAAQAYRDAAELGHGLGASWYGYMLVHGLGEAKDLERGFYWMKKGADAGHPESLNNLGRAYSRGWFGTPDRSAACMWFEKAALAGGYYGAFNFAQCKEEGVNGPIDKEEAFRWFSIAAAGGNVKAASEVGRFHQFGYGGAQQDDRLAVKWYRQAAEQGNAIAQDNLGHMYKDGRGTAVDYKQAAFWFEKAANNGNSNGMFNLANAYEKGQGKTKNLRTAYEWYKKSDAEGNKYAKARIDALNLVIEEMESLGAPTEIPFDCGPHGQVKWVGNKRSCECDSGYIDQTWREDYTLFSRYGCLAIPDFSGEQIPSIPAYCTSEEAKLDTVGYCNPDNATDRLPGEPTNTGALGQN